MNKKPKFEIYIATGKMDRLFRQILKMWRKEVGFSSTQMGGSIWKWIDQNKDCFGNYSVVEFMIRHKNKKLTYLKHDTRFGREVCFFGTIEECEAHLQKMFDELKRKEKLQSFK